MKSKRKILISTLAVVLTAALAIGVFFFYKAFKKRIDPEDQMIHNTQERIEYAQSRYKEFSKNPNKTYTVLVSLDSVTTEEFTQLFADPRFCAVKLEMPLQRRSLRSSLPTAAASPRYTTV